MQIFADTKFKGCVTYIVQRCAVNERVSIITTSYQDRTVGSAKRNGRRVRGVESLAGFDHHGSARRQIADQLLAKDLITVFEWSEVCG
jgi:hypothetical protein